MRLASLLVCAAFALAATAESYDPPESRLVYGVKGQPRDLISWRRLQRSDFLGEEPPAHLVRHAGLIGAVSCIGIELPEDASAAISAERMPTGETRYTAQLLRPRFVAIFDRFCSWWNPRSDDPEYLLQHEQIHFDLAEVAARALSEEIASGSRMLVSRAATNEAALAKLEAQIGILTKATLKALQARHARFDEETSVVRSRERQERWARELAAELSRDRAAAPE